MMARKPPRQSAHTELAGFGEKIAAAKQAEREAQLTVQSGQAEIETLKELIRQAYGDGETTARLSTELRLSREQAEQAELQLEGIARHVQQAERDRQRFSAGHSEQLIEELEASAAESVAALKEHAEALIAAHQRWHAISAEAAEYLAAAGITPVGNAPSDHWLASAIREVKHALHQPIVSPLPHLSHHSAQRQDEELRRRLKEERRARTPEIA